MEYRKLGNSGTEVSVLCLGCMSFGEPGRGTHTWTLDEEESRSIIRYAVEKGINFFDTANVYSAGSSEEIVGRGLKDFARRDEVVIATKVHGNMRVGPNGGGLSRKSIFHEIDQSLRRLETDYIDLYQVHRWDQSTPLEETLDALDHLVQVGKVLHLGASSMLAWQFSKSLHTAEARRNSRYITMQNHFNLLSREDEREMIPLCLDQNIGLLPWSPLARGRLARTVDSVSARSTSDNFASDLYDSRSGVNKVLETIEKLSCLRGVPRAQIALAWVRHQPGVIAPIVGASKISHLDDALAAVDLLLSDAELKELDEVSKLPDIRTF